MKPQPTDVWQIPQTPSHSCQNRLRALLKIVIRTGLRKMWTIHAMRPHIWVYSRICFDVKDISLYKPPFQEMYKYVLIRIVHNSMKSVILPPWHLLNEIQTEVSEVRRCSDLSLVQKMEQEVRGRSRCIIFCRCPPRPPCIEGGEFKAGFWCGRSRKKFQCACQGPVSLEVFQCLQRGKMERARSKRQGLDAGRSRLAPQSPSNISTLPFLSF